MPLIPLGLIAVTLATALIGMWRWRRRSELFDAFATALLDVTLAASIVSVLILTVPPSIPTPRTLNLVPFNELIRTSAGLRETALAQMLANVALFAPLGVLSPLRWRRIDSYPAVVAFAVAFSVAIEVTQFALGGGRQTSITDVILNTTGAVLGYSVLRLARWIARRFAHRRRLPATPG